MLVNGSSLRGEAQEFCPATGLSSPNGDVFLDAQEWYAPVAANLPGQASLPVQPLAQPEPVEGTRPTAAGLPVQSTPSCGRGNFVERTARWISGRAQAVALLFVAAATTLANKRDQFVQQFEDVFGGADAASKDHLMPPPMKGPPMQVHLKPEAVPSTCLVPRKVPYALEEATRAELAAMVDSGLIKRVTQPTPWCSPFLVVLKPKGGIRPVVDYKALNKYVVRPIHPFLAARAAVESIPKSSRYFATLDATKGYWQIRLTDEASLLTTFLTPYGRFRYTRAPMGLSSSGDEFCRRGDEALRGIDGVIKVVDDVLVHAPTLEALELRVRAVLTACRRVRITMSPKKFVFGATSASFVGFVVGPDGYHPDPAKLRAISEFPEPKNITDVRSFFGLANQLNGFTGRVAEALNSLRPMLSSKSAFVWEEPQRDAFRKARRLLSEVPIRAFYDPSKPVILMTDAANTRGLGYALVQGEEHQYQVVASNSRVLSPAEGNYSATELELLAVVWAFDQLKVYLLGLEADQCTVVVDHRPLRGKFNKTLDQEENPRILRLLEKLRPFSFTVDWREGRKHKIADALSRAPVVTADDDEWQPDVEDDRPLTYVSAALVAAVGKTSPWAGGECPPAVRCCYVANSRVDPDGKACAVLADRDHYDEREALVAFNAARADEKFFADHAGQDPEYQDLLAALRSRSRRLPAGLRTQYRAMQDRLSVHNGLVLLDCRRIVVPAGARQTVLESLHAGHQGARRTFDHAALFLHWPLMQRDIEAMCESCEACAPHVPAGRREPLLGDVASAAMEIVGTDLFDHDGRVYLVAVDAFTGYPFARRFAKTPSSRQVIETLMEFFSEFGLPNVIRSDGGRQYESAEFRDFCSVNRIDHRLSSAHYPQSNGLAESAVKRVKNVLRRVSEESAGPRSETYVRLLRGLMEMRATPLQDGLSPAEWMLHRQPRTTVPGSGMPTSAHRRRAKALQRRLAERARARGRVDQHARPLRRNFCPGDKIIAMDHVTKRWSRRGTVVETRNGSRSIRFREGGRTYLRNRKFVKAAPAAPSRRPTPPADDNQDDTTNGASDDGSRGNSDGSEDTSGSPQPQLDRPQRAKRTPARLRD